MKTRHSCFLRARIVILPAVLIVMMVMGGLPLLQSCRHSAHGGRVKDAHYVLVDSLLRDIHDLDSLTGMARQYQHDHDAVGEMLAYRYMGRELRGQSRFEEAVKAHNNAFGLATSLADTVEMATALNNIATSYRRMSDLSTANGYYFKALLLYDNYSDQENPDAIKQHIITLNGIGDIEVELCNYTAADSIFHEALWGEMSLGDYEGMAVNYGDLGKVKRALGQTDSAWYNYREALKCNQLAGYEQGVAECHHRFGELYEDERNFSHALKEYQLAYDGLKHQGETWQWIEPCLALARVHLLLGEEAEVRHYLNEAEAEAVRIKSKEHQAEAFRLHYELSLLEGNAQSALSYFSKSEELYDSIYGREKSDEMRSQRIDYQATQKSGMVDLLNKDISRLKRLRNIQRVLIVLLSLMAAAIIAALVYAMMVRNRTQRLMRQVEETRSLFFTNVVHQLRTPLSAIMGAADSIADGAANYPPEQRENVEIIERQGKNLLLLVDRILEVGSVRSEIQNLEWRRGDVVALLRMILEKYREQCVPRNIELIYAPRENSVEADTVPEYLNTIVGSLIDNAINYCQEFCKITVTSRIDHGLFIIRVADNGMGISKADLPHVFEPFYRAASAERLVEGVGIGLTVVRDMAMAMGGTVAVDSMKDQGTVFTVKLPCGHKQDVKERFDALVDAAVKFKQGSRKKVTDDVLDEGSGKGKPVVLIVEDQNDVAHLVGHVLKGKYDVQYAYDGEQGLARALELSPAVIITDMKMPQMDGCELCRQIRANSQLCETPIIMLSARTGNMDRINGIKAGADVYLIKPFVGLELMAWVDHLVERCQLKSAAHGGTVTVVPLGEGTSLDDNAFLDRFAQLVDYQLAHGETKPDFDKIAIEFKMGESQLKHRIQEITGKNVIAYVTQLRMEKAMRLLKEHPDMLIGEVAERCGFVDVAYFSRVFRHHYGMTPTQARNNNNG